MSGAQWRGVHLGSESKSDRGGGGLGDRRPPWPHDAQDVLATLSRGRAALEASHASAATSSVGSPGTAHARSLPGSENPYTPEWTVSSASPVRTDASRSPLPGSAGGRLVKNLEKENAQWRAKDQLRVEADLLAVMAEWREKVAALEDRLEHMAQRHRREKEELEVKMRGMHSPDVVSKYHEELARLQQDLVSALNLRDSALSDDLDARDTVIKELGAHLRTAHENNQRMHMELQELQAKHHEALASARFREAALQQRVEELQETQSNALQSIASPERRLLQQENQELFRELAQVKRELQDCYTEKDRLKRECEWTVSKMTAELQRAQHALALFGSEMREGKTAKDGTLQQLQRLHEARTSRLSADLDAEKQHAALLEQKLESCMLELKRKSAENSDLQASLVTASSGLSHALSAGDTILASSPPRREQTGLARSASPRKSASPQKTLSSSHLELQQQHHRHSEQEHSRMVAEVSALRNTNAAMERDRIELSSAVDAQKSKERVLIQSLQSRDGKISILEGEVEKLGKQLSRCKEYERRADQDLKEFKIQMEDEQMRLLRTIKDLEREREASMLTRNETSSSYAADAQSKLAELKDTEHRALQLDYDRALSEWKAAKLNYITKIAESNARAATAQEAIMLLEADLEMKNKLLDQVVESRGGENETLNIYVASLHHAGLIAKSLDARNKELRQKMGESEQFRLTGIFTS
jgi:hypothetical protein